MCSEFFFFLSGIAAELGFIIFGSWTGVQEGAQHDIYPVDQNRNTNN